MNKLLGKIAAGLMAIALIITGSCLFGANSNEVLAADATTAAFHTESMEVNKYVDAEGNRTAPKPTVSGYEDWIFAGWYRDKECTTAVNSKSGTRYAKFVPSEILSVKCQVTAGTKAATTQTSSLRLISTVDSLNYNEVGFEVSFDFGAENLEIPTYNVFKKIESAVEGQEYGYSPNIFDLQSEYFVTATLTNIDNQYFDDGFYIRPYWKTLDGTKVYGVSRCARVEDSYLNIVNVPVRLYSDASVTGGNVTVTYNSNLFEYVAGGYGSTLIAGTTTSASYDDPADLGTVTVDGSTAGTISVAKSGSDAIDADGMFVNLRFKRKADEANLPKKNEFTVEQSLTVADSKTVVVPNVIHTHYHTAYNGTPDMDWWNNRETGQTKFVITSPAELYGVAQLTADKTTNFGSTTIYLGSDINVNSGTVSEWKALSDSSLLYNWENTIGNSDCQYNGIFNGQGHTISGIYLHDDGDNNLEYQGLFGIATTNANIRDFKLKNSYFKSSEGWITGGKEYAVLGSVIGQLAGTMDTVYSEAVVEGDSTMIAGLAARVNSGTSTAEITNCWFDGEITQTYASESTYAYVGGIVGVHLKGTLNLTDCLNTAQITHNYTTADSSTNCELAVGGLLGGVMNYGDAKSINITNCVNSGKVVSQNESTQVVDQTGVGSIIGFIQFANVPVACVNTYATTESTQSTMIGIGPGVTAPTKKPTAVAEADIESHLAYSKLSGLSFYKTSTNSGRWVTRRASNDDSTPALKSFVESNEWFDASWYLDSKAATQYEISTLAELYAMAELTDEVDETTHINFKNKTIKLTKDIIVNAGDASKWGNTAPKNDWAPISPADGYMFAGTFDGDGHTISGLYVNSSSAKVGFFGHQLANSTVQNLKLENSYFTNNVAQNTDAYIGSISGYGAGSFLNIYSDAIVESKGNYCGGLTGSILNTNGTFNNCWFNGAVTGYTYVGGIVGVVSGNGIKVTMENCLADGNVTATMNNVAGICGWLNSHSGGHTTLELDNCIQVGSVRTGSIYCCNSVIGHITNSSIAKLTNVYTTNDVKTSSGGKVNQHVDGIGDQSTTATLQGDQKALVLTNEAVKGAAAYANTELDFHVTDENTGAWVAIKNDTPALKYFVKDWLDLEDAIRTADTAWYTENASTKKYTITTREELYGLVMLSQTAANTFAGWEIKLGNDIVYNKDLDNPINEWISICKTNGFAGTFDGQGYTISGISCIESANMSGFFGYVSATGVVKNFKLVDCYFENTNTGYAYLGSAVGFLGGDLQNVYSKATVVAAGYECGGLVGRFGMTSTNKMISNCWFDGIVTSNKKAAEQGCGGIVGEVNLGTKNIQNCLVTGIVNGNCDLEAGTIGTGGIVGVVGRGSTTPTPTLTMTSCVSAGTTNVDLSYGAGSIIGKILTGSSVVNISNTYTTNNITNVASPSTAIANKNSAIPGIGNGGGGTLTGATYIKSIDQLTGAQARYNTVLDFYLGEDNDGVWVTRKNKTLALKNFVPANEWYTADETIVADKSWHVNKGTSQEYIIMTAAELYGLSEIVAAQENGFNQDTVRLGANIVVNNGDAKTWSTTPAVNSWTPIGNTTQGFVGTFDGQGYTISGLYTKTPSSYVGLFGHASNNAAFKNVRLVNTYFEQSDASAMFLGSILGNADNGSINNVYSDAILVSAGGYVGGIIGRVGGGTSYPTYTLNNCWFEGDIISPKQYLGGILGVVFRANINMTNALFTGTITSTYADNASGARVGGLCSNPMEQSVLNIADCISAGKISDNCNGHTVGSIVGRVSAGQSDVNITNVFATVECSASTFGSVDDGNENKDDILGTVVRATETDRLIGFCTEKTGEALDFENDWVMRTSGVPVLKCFDDLVSNKVVIADGTTLDATLTAELGLDMNIFGSNTMKTAVNYGLGNYQISVPGITLDQYNGASGYLKKLESLGFELYVTNADSTMDDDGVYNAIYTKDAGDWVINATFSTNTKELNVNISTAGKKSLSKNLKKENVTSSGEQNITLSMLSLTGSEVTSSDGNYSGYYGNSFVIQLPDGHFIINDGGAKDDFEGLISYLEKLAGGEDKKIYVDAWTVSHQHNDHFDVMNGFITNPDVASKVHVEAFYLNEPNRETLYDESITMQQGIEKQYRGIYSLTKADGVTTPDIFWYQTGQRYYFNGLTMDVIQSQEQLAFEEYGQNAWQGDASDMSDYNASSTILLFTTATGEKVLIGGDATYKNMELVIDLYGDQATSTLNNINVYTAFHHGKNTSYTLTTGDSVNVFTDYLLKGTKNTFDVVLFPASYIHNNNYTSSFPGATVANVYLQQKSTCHYHYGNGTVVITLNGNTVTESDISVISK